MGLRTKLQQWADELRAIAQNGLSVAATEHDRANYRRLWRLAAEITVREESETAFSISGEWQRRTGRYMLPQSTTRPPAVASLRSARKPRIAAMRPFGEMFATIRAIAATQA